MKAHRVGWTALVVAGLLAVASIAPRGSGDQTQRSQATTGLVKVVRDETAQFKSQDDAVVAGYAPANGCVSGPERGAMGLHYVNGDLVADGGLDPRRPEALIYEQRHGRMRLVGVEYLVLADAWHAKNEGPPVLMGHLAHYVDSPNRYGLPAFYELHVWAWKDNPHGMFADWNPDVSCEQFAADASPFAAATDHVHVPTPRRSSAPRTAAAPIR
jgi:hypothetical protein